MTQNNSICSGCGAPLTGESPMATLCPRCLLSEGLDHDPGTVPTSAPSSSSGWQVPTAEELDAKLPHLDVLRHCGSGGMGAVYHARQSMLGREVAIKVLSPRVSGDPTFEERFAREARALAQLSHPAIVAVHDFGQVDGMYFLVMEYVDGVDLRQAMQTTKLGTSQTLKLVQQICDALQYAHSEGVVHRDIKPENVLIDQKGRVKLADFGLAKMVHQEPGQATLTMAGQVMGTAGYMAPEQWSDPDNVDHRADIFSLGVVFYELLTGQLPLGRFSLPSETGEAIDGLDEIVLRTLERYPEKRYQQASEVNTAIEELPPVNLAARSVSERSVEDPAKNVSRTAKAVPDAAVGRQSDFVQTVPRSWNPGSLMTITVLCLLAIGLLIYGAIHASYTIWIGLGIGLSGVYQAVNVFSSGNDEGMVLLESPNAGVLFHALGFIWTGTVLMPGASKLPVLFWVGMGLIIAGAYLFYNAYRPVGQGKGIQRWSQPMWSVLIPALGSMFFGLCLLLIGIFSDNIAFLWVGMGLMLAGSSVGSEGWKRRLPDSE